MYRQKTSNQVNLVYFYRPKALEVTDCIPDILPSIKRGGEGVLLPVESPVKKKSKSAIIDQYTSASTFSSTARVFLQQTLVNYSSSMKEKITFERS